MSAVIAALESDGLLTRTQDPLDRRRVVVEATEEGARRLAAMDRAARATIAKALAPLSDDDLDRVRDGLTLLVEALDVHRHGKGAERDRGPGSRSS
jgi:DNA-binding MarR family transcriptional regulator